MVIEFAGPGISARKLALLPPIQPFSRPSRAAGRNFARCASCPYH